MKTILLLFVFVTCSICFVAKDKEPVVLSSKNYLEKVKSEKLLIVDAWAPWCGPCRKLRPMLEEAAIEAGVLLGTLNVDIYPEFVGNQLNISTIPTMIFYKDGKEVKRLSGVFSKEELLGVIDLYLK